MISPLWQVVLACGSAMCLMAGGYIFLLLRFWPRVFLKRYPEVIRKAVEPLSPRERLVGITVSVPFFIALIAFPVWASYRIVVETNASFIDTFLAAYGTWMAFNLFDWLVLDELVVGYGRPSWLILPGTEHIPLTFNHSEHALAFVKGTLGGAILSVIIAYTVPLLL